MRTVDQISCVFKMKGGGRKKKDGSGNDEMGNLNEEVVLHDFFFETGFVQEDWETRTDWCNLQSASLFGIFYSAFFQKEIVCFAIAL